MDMQTDAVVNGLNSAGVQTTFEYPGAVVLHFANSLGRYEVWTGFLGWEYGSISMLDIDGTWQPIEGEAGTAEPYLSEDETDTAKIVSAWAAWVAERVEPTLERAVCACGFVTTDPTALELWNGYGDHEGSAQLTDPQCRVSVWTLTDGTITIADNRENLGV